jgi:hypothetical protein
LLPHEWSSVVPLCAIALMMGVFPSVFLKPTEPAVTRIVDRLRNTQTLRVDRSQPERLERIVERSERLERSERFEGSERSERPERFVSERR